MTSKNTIERDEALAIYQNALNCEPYITEMMKGIAYELRVNLVGLENRVKEYESYFRKYESTHKRISDIIRYTCILELNVYIIKMNQILDKLKTNGYNINVIKNTWKQNSPYKGINVVLESPNNLLFEVQFHTKESFELKNGELHTMYKRQRVIPKDSAEYIDLKLTMIKLSSGLIHPRGVEEIK